MGSALTSGIAVTPVEMKFDDDGLDAARINRIDITAPRAEAQQRRPEEPQPEAFHRPGKAPDWAAETLHAPCAPCPPESVLACMLQAASVRVLDGVFWCAAWNSVAAPPPRGQQPARRAAAQHHGVRASECFRRRRWASGGISDGRPGTSGGEARGQLSLALAGASRHVAAATGVSVDEEAMDEEVQPQSLGRIMLLPAGGHLVVPAGPSPSPRFCQSKRQSDFAKP
jgi:hypothetical protein